MKFINEIKAVSSKKKALYLAWVTIHFLLFLFSGNFISEFESDFYPFGFLNNRRTQIWDYDYSEFLFYTTIPIILWYIYRLWNADNTKE